VFCCLPKPFRVSLNWPLNTFLFNTGKKKPRRQRSLSEGQDPTLKMPPDCGQLRLGHPRSLSEGQENLTLKHVGYPRSLSEGQDPTLKHLGQDASLTSLFFLKHGSLKGSPPSSFPLHEKGLSTPKLEKLNLQGLSSQGIAIDIILIIVHMPFWLVYIRNNISIPHDVIY
jgi:hypothetical protein